MRMLTDSPENYSQSSRVVAGVSAKMLAASLLHSSVEHLTSISGQCSLFYKWDENLDGNLDSKHSVQSSGDHKTLHIPACLQFKWGDISDTEAATQIISCIPG